MTSGLYWVSYGAVWVLLLVLSVSQLMLFRFCLRIYQLRGPADTGDVGTLNGPILDERPPPLELNDTTGGTVFLGPPTGMTQFVMFARSTCPRCRTAIDVLRSYIRESDRLEAIVVCGGKQRDVRDCASLIRPGIRALADVGGKGAREWGVSRVPFGVVLDANGVVRARGEPTSTAMLTVLRQYTEGELAMSSAGEG